MFLLMRFTKNSESTVYSFEFQNTATVEANIMNRDQTAPSLIWVYIVCSIGHQFTEAVDIADVNCREW